MQPSTSPLLTDLYQFTMLQAYLDQDMHETAVFEFFIRKLPHCRGFLMAAGLEQVLHFLEHFKFSDMELDYLARTGRFKKNLIDYLTDVRFCGDVHAIHEGTIFFPDEPILRVTAPIPVAQLLESRLINILHLETLLASKAVRCTLASAGRASLIDFGLRRAHGDEAGLHAARASYITGFEGTATVLAEPLFGIPVFGTMAHSFIEAHADEKSAFIDFAESNPGNVMLLIDTYDTISGARKAAEVAKILRGKGIRVRGIRLDSGDLLELAKQVRAIFDNEGLHDLLIFASGNIDEYLLQALLDGGAPINGFGVGTKMDTSSDAPYLDCAYKLVEYAGKPRLKKSDGKTTWPGRKQVFRRYQSGEMQEDILTLDGDDMDGKSLIKLVMTDGTRVSETPSLKEIRAHALARVELSPSRSETAL
jgi:nicotinate phosphoribosyltransferase